MSLYQPLTFSFCGLMNFHLFIQSNAAPKTGGSENCLGIPSSLGGGETWILGSASKQAARELENRFPSF